jgi:phosphomannomutase
MVSPDFANRPFKKLLLFDVDGTLTPARQVCLLGMIDRPYVLSSR